jgi:hypothetical protein
MSEAIRKIQERIEKNKFSRELGLRAICARADAYEALNGGPAIKYEWLRKVVDGRTPNPGFERMDRLNTILDLLEQESGEVSSRGTKVDQPDHVVKKQGK